MKKLFAVLALAGVLVSCDSKKKEDKKVEGDTTTTTTTTVDPAPTTTTTTTTTTNETPKFADAEVQKYVDDYAAFVRSYVDAYKGKDMTKVQELSAKMSDWSTRSAAISQKLAASPDEAKKFSDYMVKLSQDWADAAKAMTPSN